MYRLSLFVYLILLFELPTANAADYYLVFSNGMRNTLQDAELSLQQLRRKILADRDYQSKKRQQSLELPWNSKNAVVAYNFKDDLIMELKEVYEQKKTEKSRSFWKWYYEEERCSEEFKKIIYEEMLRCELEHRIGETLFSQSEVMDELLDKDFRLLIVSHSQGNLFSNSFFETQRLHEDQFRFTKISLLSVATPASYVADRGPYVTLSSDGVINNVLPILLGDEAYEALPANTTNTQPDPGSFDHGFVEFYLEGDKAGRKIMDHIYNQFFKS